MMTPPTEHQYQQFHTYPRWLIEWAVDYAATHRNREYIPLLLRAGRDVLKAYGIAAKESADWKWRGR